MRASFTSLFRHGRPTAHAEEPRRRLPLGFSLVEVLVASAIFILIMMAVYQVYIRSLQAHKQGVNLADMVQSTRFGFDEMATRIRAAGFEFDVDGVSPTFANQSDESIEFMGAHAIIVRANYDFNQEALRGREESLEIDPNEPDSPDCCPVVTTGNDEIIGFALGKDLGASDAPTGTITAYFDLSAPRDGRVGITDGNISGEETVTIESVELDDDPGDPPYVLYQFTWDDDGNVVRRPLVDNIIELNFTYYDEGGNAMTPVGGGPDPSSDEDAEAADRLTRQEVRKILIELKGMTPEPDLAYVDPDDTNADTEHHRKFVLSEEVHTFNVGRRGQVDKDVNPPGPVQDVQACSGECGMLRIDWLPAPPEDRITDHIIIVAECEGGSNPDWNDPLASFVVVADFDLTQDPPREFAVFNDQDDLDLIDDRDICVRVVARDETGAESEAIPGPGDANVWTTIDDTTRPEGPSDGFGSGFDNTANDWPDGKPDNSGTLTIVTDVDDPSYPQEGQIRLEAAAPIYQLNLGETGTEPYNWTTRTTSTGYDGEAALTCHRAEISPENDTANLRTPTDELSETTTRPNVYVFRVSGSDDSNWGSGVTQPRNFMPSADNLYAAYSYPIAGGQLVFIDSSDSTFEGDSDNQYEHRFVSTNTYPVEPDGGKPHPRAVTPGEVYYYRFRVADNCWEDDDLDGIRDDTEGDAVEVTAWSISDDFVDGGLTDDNWRQEAITLSPFYPPLLPRGSSSGEKDRPSGTVDDSDGVDREDLAGDMNTWAIPGYAIPVSGSDGTQVRPEKPTELYIARVNDSTSDFLEPSTGDTRGTRILFNSAKRDAPDDTGVELEPTNFGYAWYRLCRKAVSYNPEHMNPGDAETTAYPDDYTTGYPAISDLSFTEAGADECVTEVRLSRDGLEGYTIDRVGEVLDGRNAASGNTDLELTIEDDTNPGQDAGAYYSDGSGRTWVYRLFTVQVSDSSDGDLPTHVSDDGITTDAAKVSVGSRPFLWPCDFYYQVEEVDLDLTPENGVGVTAVSATVEMDLSADDPPTTDREPCRDVRASRLLAYNASTGEYLGSSDWEDWDQADTDPCVHAYSSDAIDDALRGYGGRASFRVELSNSDHDDGLGFDGVPRGCRVRSDLTAHVSLIDLELAEGTDCGTTSEPNILGFDAAAVPEGETPIENGVKVTLEDNDKVLVIELENKLAGDQDFRLEMLEVELSLGSADAPRLLYGELSGTRVGLLRLGDPDEDLDVTAGVLRLRWDDDAFCDDTCNYPVVDSDASSIELRLRFADTACNPVALQSLNFLVPVTDPSDTVDGVAELLCSQRSDDELLDEADPPEQGPGRGSAEAEACLSSPECEPQCDADECPINSDAATEPATELDDSDADSCNGTDGTQNIVRIKLQESCSVECELTLVSLDLEIQCQAGRFCAFTGELPEFQCAQLRHDYVQGNTNNPDDLVLLGAPSLEDTDGTPLDSSDEFIHLTWDELLDEDGNAITVTPLEEFVIELIFDDDMDNTLFSQFDMVVGDPLDPEATCGFTTPIDIPNE